jgi:hypothetical protein
VLRACGLHGVSQFRFFFYAPRNALALEGENMPKLAVGIREAAEMAELLA